MTRWLRSASIPSRVDREELLYVLSCSPDALLSGSKNVTASSPNLFDFGRHAKRRLRAIEHLSGERDL